MTDCEAAKSTFAVHVTACMDYNGGLALAACVAAAVGYGVLQWARRPSPSRADQALHKYRFAHRTYDPAIVPKARFAREYRFVTARGVSLAAYATQPSRPARGLVFVFPGLNECVLRNAHVAGSLKKREVAVFAVDYPGFGRSEGRRGYTGPWPELLDDLLSFVEATRREHGEHLPVFFVGQSMGGLMALLLAMRRPSYLRGIVLLAPAIQSDLKPLWQLVAKHLGRALPWLPTVRLGDADMGCSNVAVAEQLEQDPDHVVGPMLAGMGAQIVVSLQHVRREARRVDVPALIMQGGRDLICSPAGAAWLFGELATEDKQLVELPDMWHDLLHEPEHQRVVDKVAAWIARRLC